MAKRKKAPALAPVPGLEQSQLYNDLLAQSLIDSSTRNQVPPFIPMEMGGRAQYAPPPLPPAVIYGNLPPPADPALLAEYNRFLSNAIQSQAIQGQLPPELPPAALPQIPQQALPPPQFVPEQLPPPPLPLPALPPGARQPSVPPTAIQPSGSRRKNRAAPPLQMPTPVNPLQNQMNMYNQLMQQQAANFAAQNVPVPPPAAAQDFANIATGMQGAVQPNIPAPAMQAQSSIPKSPAQRRPNIFGQGQSINAF